MGVILLFLIEYLTSKFFDWLIDNASKNPKFFGIKNNISLHTQNESIKELLSISLENALRNEKIKNIDHKEIELSLKENMHIIFEWIVISDASFAKYSDIINYNANEERFKMLYNSIFHQIQANKNNYSTLQNLMILNKLDEIDSKVTTSYEILKNDNRLLQIITQNMVYTGDLKEIEEKIKLRQFKEARSRLSSLEHKILGRGEAEETEKYYQLLTDSYFFDSANQHETIKHLEKLIVHTPDTNRRKKRETLKYLLEGNYKAVQNTLDYIFTEQSDLDIDPAYFDIQTNSYILQKKLDLAIDFVQKNKEKIVDHPFWLCRLYYYQSRIIEAKKILEENEEYFNKSDFDIQLIKIYVFADCYLEQAADNKSFYNIQIFKNFIPDVEEMIIRCEDEIGIKSQMHSILGLIYAVLNDPDKAKIEYEKSIEFCPKNMNTLKNYPSILINSRNKEDKERAVAYIEEYLSEYPEDQLIETLYFNALVFISPQTAVIKLQNYNGINKEAKPFLLYAYDVLFEFSKAEELIIDLLSKENISSSAYFFIALHYEAINKYDTAMDYYFKALDNGETNIDLDRAIDKLFRLSMSLKNKVKIKECIEAIEKLFSPEEIAFSFMDIFTSALLIIFEYEKCCYYCTIALQQDIKAKYIYESLFSCYYNTKNFQLAVEIIEKYIDDFCQLPSHYLQFIATCYIQIDKLDKAYDIVKYLRHPESVNEYLLQVQFFKQIKKDNEAINMAHKAYLAFPKNQKTMELFLNLCLNKGNCVLSEEIVNDLNLCFSCYIKSDFPNKIIKEHLLNTNVEPEELKKQLSNIIPDNKDLMERLELIDREKLPMVFYKKVLNRNLLFIHHYLISQQKAKIWCFDGVFNISIISKSHSVYIDLCSLLLLDTIGLLNTLPEYFSEINISQSIFDELRDFESEIPPSNKAGIISKDADGNILFTKDDIPYNDIFEKSKRIITFFKTNSAVKIVGKPLKTINNMPPDLLKLFKSTKFDIDLDIFEYGYLSNTPVMLENIICRRLFNSLSNTPKAFCIIDYLQFLLSSKRLIFSEYCRILSLMSKQNYVCLPLDYRVLYLLIQNNGYIIDNSITHIFNVIFSDHYDKNYVTINVLNIIYMIWNTMIHNEIKYKWTDYLMDKIIVSRKPVLSELNQIGHVVSRFIYNMKFRNEFNKFFEKYLKDNSSKQ